MGIPAHSALRKKARKLMYAVLGKLFPSRKTEEKIDPAIVKRILIIRINYRIGNIIFLTPLIKALGKRLPHASVDVVIGSAYTKNMLSGMPNVGEIFDAPRKLLKNPFRLFREIKKLNANNYDLIINVSRTSSTNSIVASLLRAPMKLGYYDENNWLPLTHAVSLDGADPHMALQPLALMSAFSGDDGDYEKFLDINLSEAEKQQGREDLVKFSEQQHYQRGERHLIGIFRNARNNKIIADSYWQELVESLQVLRENLDIVDILVPGQEKLPAAALQISSPDLRVLGGMLSQLDAFICADTGPMHLASAARTPTIALFKATRPARYGTLGEHDLSLEIQNLACRDVAQGILDHLAL
ncbi:MAG: glycosyltransferase family 9 protein [Gammaproteobacteria bacterium]|nr:glycosyltransferase family 9 protein [Gammaproteobacteria bacterium]